MAQHPPETIAPRAAAHLAAASGLGRLLGLVAIYPRTHSRICDALETVRAGCEQCEDAFLAQVTSEGLTSRHGDLPLGDAGIEYLHGVLRALAVQSLRIEASASADDIYELAAAVQRHKARSATSSKFSRIDLTSEVPQSVRVTHRTFGMRLVSESVASQWLPDAPERVLRYLEDCVPGLDLGPAAAFLTGIVARVVERIEHGALGPADSSTRARPLDSVLDLCAHAMKHALERLLREGDHLHELSRLARNVEQAVAIAHDRQGAEVMLDVLGLATRQLDDRRVLDDDHAVGCSLSLEELRRQVDGLGGDTTSFFDRAAEESEQLTILVQISQRMSVAELTELGDRLSRLCSGGCGPQAIAILARGVADFAATMDVESVDSFVPIVFDAVRQAGGDGPRDLVHQLLSSQLTKAASTRLWPHLVNELVQMPPSTAGSPASITLPVVAEGDFASCIRRLVRLDAVRKQLVSVRVLDSTDSGLREGLARLLDRPEADPVGRRLLDELRQGPRRWPAFEVVHALVQYDDNARLILKAALRAGPGAGASEALRQASARLLLATLQDMQPARRSEAWVAEAIAGLGGYRDPDPARLLAGVLRRRHLLWPLWPAPCRRAARAALARRRSAAKEGR